MDLEKLLYEPDEKPLDRIVYDGGYARVFRTIGCVGDSLSSGEHEARDENGNVDGHMFFDSSWGQYMARNAGINVFNFSTGGMTAKKFIEEFGDSCGIWTDEKKCQAYILALGVNDMHDKELEVGSAQDIDLENHNNKCTFAGYFGKIIQRIKKHQPDAKIFLVARPRYVADDSVANVHARLMHEISKLFSNTYVIDLNAYAPVYDEEFRKKFFVGCHMNAAGYILTAQMITSYIDYIVRHNFEDFSQTAFIGTPYKYL